MFLGGFGHSGCLGEGLGIIAGVFGRVRGIAGAFGRVRGIGA